MERRRQLGTLRLRVGCMGDCHCAIGCFRHFTARMGQLSDIRSLYNSRGAAPGKPHLSARPFRVTDDGVTTSFRGAMAVGLIVTGHDGREYNMLVQLLWDDEGWAIDTQAWVEADDGGQELLRETSTSWVGRMRSRRRQCREAGRHPALMECSRSCGVRPR